MNARTIKRQTNFKPLRQLEVSAREEDGHADVLFGRNFFVPSSSKHRKWS